MSGGRVKLTGRARKSAYMENFVELLETHSTVFVVLCDNVGSSHMQRIRQSIRGKAILLMGKNTLMRKAIHTNHKVHPEWEVLLPLLRNNVGFVFTNGDMLEVKELLLSQRVPAAAKSGSIAPVDVVVKKGLTGLEPTKTSFLQALQINSKITRGVIEILKDVELISVGERVGPSQAALLQMLDIRPFSYGLEIQYVYDDGEVYDASVLDVTVEDILKTFSQGVANVASLSLGAHVPSLAAFPHVVMDGYKNLLAVVAETDYVFEQAAAIKEILENPDAFVVQQAPVVAEEEEESEPEPEPESSSGEMMGGGLFGGDSDSW